MVGMFKLNKNNSLRSITLEGCFIVLLALALGHAGPYGTFEEFGLVKRIVYWMSVIILPWAMFKGMFLAAKMLATVNISNTFLVVLLTPMFALMGSAVTTQINIKVGLITEQTFFEVWPYSILTWLVFAFLIILPMTLIASALAKETRKSGVADMMTFLHQKLPESIQGAQLLALKAEDHYLKVFTDCGSALILMKFEDALSVLNGYPGVQTHRSWWVASCQLEGLSEVPAASPHIQLPDGEKVPISRRKRKAVNEYIGELSSTKPA